MYELTLPTFDNAAQPRRLDGYPALNEPLLMTVLDLLQQIEDTGYWNQGCWRQEAGDWLTEELVVNNNTCGTAMCFAGWAAHLASPTWADQLPGYASNYVAEDLLATQAEIDDGFGYYHTGGHLTGETTVTLSTRAKRVLGLTDYEADILFHGDNDLSTLSGIIGGLLEGKTRIPGQDHPELCYALRAELGNTE